MICGMAKVIGESGGEGGESSTAVALFDGEIKLSKSLVFRGSGGVDMGCLVGVGVREGLGRDERAFLFLDMLWDSPWSSGKMAL